MARCVVLSLPTHGHINPTLPLVAELIRRGEHVVYYATDAFRDKIERTGVIYRSYNRHSNFPATETQGGPFGFMARAIEAAEQMLPRLLEELRAEPPDYLVLDSMCVWGRLAQQVLRCPAITSCTTIALSRRIFLEVTRRGVPQPPLRDLVAGIRPLLRYFRIARRVDQRYGTRSPKLFEFSAINLWLPSASVSCVSAYIYRGPRLRYRAYE